MGLLGDAVPDFASLTPRERDCLLALAELDDAKSVARRLALSPHTVNNHLQSAMRKLEVRKSDRAARLYAAHIGVSENSSGDVSPMDRDDAEPPMPFSRQGATSSEIAGQLREERSTFAFDQPIRSAQNAWPLRRRGEISNRLSPTQRLVSILLIAVTLGLIGLIVISTGSALSVLERQARLKTPHQANERR
jgi:DNA-binding CsgD family transcriptional regulator